MRKHLPITLAACGFVIAVLKWHNLRGDGNIHSEISVSICHGREQLSVLIA